MLVVLAVVGLLAPSAIGPAVSSYRHVSTSTSYTTYSGNTGSQGSQTSQWWGGPPAGYKSVTGDMGGYYNTVSPSYSNVCVYSQSAGIYQQLTCVPIYMCNQCSPQGTIWFTTTNGFQSGVTYYVVGIPTGAPFPPATTYSLPNAYAYTAPYEPTGSSGPYQFDLGQRP